MATQGVYCRHCHWQTYRARRDRGDGVMSFGTCRCGRELELPSRREKASEKARAEVADLEQHQPKS